MNNKLKLLKLSVCLLAITVVSESKIYERCNLARDLKFVHKIPENEIATWVCIAKYESHFNTSAQNFDTGDHGILQISQLFWCSTKETQIQACALPCTALRDDSIEDDLICARRIYNEHKRLSGNGFNAWVVFPLHCANNVEKHIEGCFDDVNNTIYDVTSEKTQQNNEDDDGYDFPALPNRPLALKQLDTPILDLISPSTPVFGQSTPILSGFITSSTQNSNTPFVSFISNQLATSQRPQRPFANLLANQLTTRRPLVNAFLNQVTSNRPVLNVLANQITANRPVLSQVLSNAANNRATSQNQITEPTLRPFPTRFTLPTRRPIGNRPTAIYNALSNISNRFRSTDTEKVKSEEIIKTRGEKLFYRETQFNFLRKPTGFKLTAS